MRIGGRLAPRRMHGVLDDAGDATRDDMCFTQIGFREGGNDRHRVTDDLDLFTPDVDAFGATLRDVGQSREIGWVAMTDDEAFARAAGATRLQLVVETGELRRDRRRLRDWFR